MASVFGSDVHITTYFLKTKIGLLNPPELLSDKPSVKASTVLNPIWDGTFCPKISEN